MKISIIFFVQVVLVFVLSCESPVQDTKKEPEKIVPHDMWDYLNGTWKVIDSPVISGTMTFSETTGTVLLRITLTYPDRVLTNERTDRVKTYRKGSTEILSLVGKVGDNIVNSNYIIQRLNPNNMILTSIESGDPPKSLKPLAGENRVFKCQKIS